jgi:YHS domain-containing protein
MQRRSLIATFLVAALWSGTSGAAGHVNTDAHGLALKGYDPVAYFTQNRPVKGSAEFSLRHDGATYRFVSASHRALFASDPGKYLPQYGGYCAHGVALGRKADIDPAAFTVVDGRLYLNFDADIDRIWRRDMAGFVTAADSRWPSLARE